VKMQASGSTRFKNQPMPPDKRMQAAQQSWPADAER